MDVFDLILKAIFQESENNNVFFTSETCKISDCVDEKYDKAVNRLAYLYKYGIFNAYFFKKCISNFVKNFSENSKFIDQIHTSKVICSLSIGPGIDILGLISAFRDIGKTFRKNVSFKIISNHGEWRNSMNALISVAEPNLPILGTFKLLQCNVIKFLSIKAKNYLKEAGVVIMDHAFASKKADKQTIIKTLINILLALKPETLLIVIDTSVKISYYESLNMFGEFVYGPIEINIDDIPYRDSIAKTIGVEPKRSGKAYFGVWCKSNLPTISDKKIENKLEKTASLINVVPAGISFEQKFPQANIINNKYGSDDSIAISNKSVNDLSFSSSSVSLNLQENHSNSSDFSDNIQNVNEDFKKLLRSLDGLVTKLEQYVDLDRNSANCNHICKSCMHCRCCVSGNSEI